MSERSDEPSVSSRPGLPVVQALLSWQFFYGRRQTWQELVRRVAEVDSLELFAHSTHWNAVFHGVIGQRRSELDGVLLQTLIPPQYRNHLERSGSAVSPMLVCRQSFLVLSRLALEVGGEPGTGRSVQAPELFEILLSVNDLLDHPVIEGNEAPWPFGDADLRARWAMARRLIGNAELSNRHNVVRMFLRSRRMMKLNAALQAESGSVDLEGLVQRATGLSLDTFWFLATAVFLRSIEPTLLSTTDEKPGSTLFAGNLVNFSPETLSQGVNVGVEDAAKFLAYLSRPFGAWKSGAPRLQPENSNFLDFRLRPFVDIGRGIFRLVDRDFLVERAANVIFFGAKDQLCEEAPSGAARSTVIQTFGGWWGNLHEKTLNEKLTASRWKECFHTTLPGCDLPPSDGIFKGATGWALLEYKATLLPVQARHSPNALPIARALARVLRSEETWQAERRRYSATRGSRSSSVGPARLSATCLSGSRLS